MAYLKGAGQKAHRREVMRAAERLAVSLTVKQAYLAKCAEQGKNPGATAKAVQSVKVAEQVLLNLRRGLAPAPVIKKVKAKKAA